MRLVFFGSPEPAAHALEALIAEGHDVAFVVTQPDRRRARNGQVLGTPVKQAAERLGLTVRDPERASEVVDACVASGAEVGVVVAFGQLLPDSLLEAFPRGCINVHYSLLPRWRGAAPVARAILAGDSQTGVSIMQLESGLDTGPVYATATEAIDARDTTGSLLDRLDHLGAQLLLDTLPKLDGLAAIAQSGTVTLAEKVSVDEFQLDWNLPAEALDRIIRAGHPAPGAWTTVGGGRCKVLEAQLVAPPELPVGVVAADGAVATGDGGLRLVRIQPAGKPAMDIGAWLAGRRGAEARLGS